MNYKCLALVAALLVACGDDDSSSVAPETSYSSARSGLSSSADMGQSSSSMGDLPKSSSSVEKAVVSGGFVTDPRDGHSYRVFVSDNQTWMAENLNFAVDSSWCYDDKEENCEKYGRLYPWRIALQIGEEYNKNGYNFNVVGKNATDENYQGVCPPGWHIPSVDEFDALVSYALYNRFNHEAFCRLIKQNAWNGEDVVSVCEKFMESGFNALPVGERNEYDSFEGMNKKTSFWSSNDLYSSYDKRAETLSFVSGDAKDARTDASNVFCAHPVRCLMD